MKKIFKPSKKFKKVKLLKNTIRELQKENEHLRSSAKVKQQEFDRIINQAIEANE